MSDANQLVTQSDNRSLSERAMANMPNLPAGVRAKRQVTRAVLRQLDNQWTDPFVFTSSPYVGEELRNGRGGAPKMAAARLCEITNLVTGEPMLLIMNTVLESELDRAFPASAMIDGQAKPVAGYLNKAFTILQIKPSKEQIEADKRYARYKIIELEIEPGVVKAASAIDATTKEAVDHAKAKGKAHSFASPNGT